MAIFPKDISHSVLVSTALENVTGKAGNSELRKFFHTGPNSGCGRPKQLTGEYELVLLPLGYWEQIVDGKHP